MPIEKRNAVLDAFELNRVGIVDARSVSLHVHKAMYIVLVRFPLRFLCRLLQQVITYPEDALQLVAVTALHQDGRADCADPLKGDIQIDASTNLIGFPHQHALDIHQATIRIDVCRIVGSQREKLVVGRLTGNRRFQAIVF